MSARAPAIGIDLGTSYSCVGVFQHGKVEIIANEMGKRTTPSYVAFTKEGRLVGEAAKDQMRSNPSNTLFETMRLIGRKFEDESVQSDMKNWPFHVISDDGGKPKLQVEYKGRQKSVFPEEVSAMILAHLKETAEAYLGQTVTHAVVALPAYFNESQRQAIKDAATIAGLNVLRIINGPNAAAITYGLDKLQNEEKGERNVFIFDLGGGTTNISILIIEDGIFEVKWTAGNMHLGGADFDNRMVTYLVKEFQRKYKKDLRSNKRALLRLRTACEQAKRTLSTSTQAEIELDYLFDGIDFYPSITRAKFEELNVDLLCQISELLEKSLCDAKMTKADIHEIVLVGGSTRIPKVQQLIKDFFDGMEPIKSVNPDEAMACGAAVQAAVLHGDMSTRNIQDVLLLDCTALSLGISVCNGLMNVILKRNTPIPSKQRNEYTTPADNDTYLTIKVFEGEFPLVKDNNFLGKFELDGIPPAPAGVTKVEVEFGIDGNGSLCVTATEMSTGVKNMINIRNDTGSRGLKEENIEQIIKEFREYRADDQRLKDRVSAKNSLESCCFNMKRKAGNGRMMGISEEDRRVVMAKCSNVLQWLDANGLAEKEEFEEMQKDLEKIWNQIITQTAPSGAGHSDSDEDIATSIEVPKKKMKMDYQKS